MLAGLAACGGDENSGVVAEASTSSTESSDTTGSNITNTTSKDQTKKREQAALPAGGPVDQVFPPGDRAYEQLAAGQCDKLRREVDTWDGQGVADAEGQDTIELYRSAADACLHNWTRAIAAFHRIATRDFGADCARQAVLAWLEPLIASREADADFDPEFVPARGEGSPCPDDDASTTETTISG
jgi:hypothetical protein